MLTEWEGRAQKLKERRSKDAPLTVKVLIYSLNKEASKLSNNVLGGLLLCVVVERSWARCLVLVL